MVRSWETVGNGSVADDKISAAVNAVTIGDVIRKRQTELLVESQELSAELITINDRRLSIHRRLAEINMEHQALDSVGDHGRVTFVRETLTTTIHTGRSGRRLPSDRVTFEDAVRRIFDAAGRPMTPKELIGELEKYGYMWSAYKSAYAAITTSRVIEKVGGVRGMFQYLRS